MRSVLVICAENDQRFFLTTLLGRNDIHLRMETSLKGVLPAIMRSPPDLLLLREHGGEALRSQIDDLACSFPVVPFIVALIGYIGTQPALPAFVKKILPLHSEVGRFNEAIAELLDLPTRRSARFPIRIGVDLTATAMSAIANTINISSTGMLIESSKALVPGKLYQFRFMAMARLSDIPAIKARVVREETAGSSTGGTLRYAVEFVDIPPERMDEVIEILLA